MNISTRTVLVPANGVTLLDYDAPNVYREFSYNRDSATLTVDQFLGSSYLTDQFRLSYENGHAQVVYVQAAPYVPEGGLARYPQSDDTLIFIDGYAPLSVPYADVLAKLLELAG